MESFNNRITRIIESIKITNTAISSLRDVRTRVAATDMPAIDTAISNLETLNHTRRLIIDQIKREREEYIEVVRENNRLRSIIGAIE